MQHKKYSTRKSATSTVGEAITELLKSYQLQGRFDEARLVSSWENLMGKTIASRTKKIYIKKQVLFVEITSPPLKHKLNMSKSKIIAIFDKDIGAGIVKEIIFI